MTGAPLLRVRPPTDAAAAADDDDDDDAGDCAARRVRPLAGTFWRGFMGRTAVAGELSLRGESILRTAAVGIVPCQPHTETHTQQSNSVIVHTNKVCSRPSMSVQGHATLPRSVHLYAQGRVKKEEKV